MNFWNSFSELKPWERDIKLVKMLPKGLTEYPSGSSVSLTRPLDFIHGPPMPHPWGE